MNLWMFLMVGALGGVVFAIVAILSAHKQKMRVIELDMVRAKTSDSDIAALRKEVESTMDAKLLAHAKRIETLEAIVTDKNYDLHQKINDL